MFRLQRKQRHDLPEKAQLSKYYEMDGALRAYANRMAVLGLLCGSAAVIALGLFAYVRLQPPVVIRVDQAGEATVVGGDTVRLSRGLVPPVQAQATSGQWDRIDSKRYRRPGHGEAVSQHVPHVHSGECRAPVRGCSEHDDGKLASSHDEQISRRRHAWKNQKRLNHVEH